MPIFILNFTDIASINFSLLIIANMITVWECKMIRREQMVSDGVMLTYDQDHWNAAHPDAKQIQLPLDLTFDVDLRRAAPDEPKDEAA